MDPQDSITKPVPPEILARLAADRNWEPRLTTAYNAPLPIEVLKRMASLEKEGEEAK